MTREAELLEQLALRPDDRALRLVYADWLLEQGDLRGEVISLCERGRLSLTERRQVARLTARHAAAWLGPLAELADFHRTRFSAGFVDELVCQPQRSPELWARLSGDPRLATVTSLVVPPGVEPGSLAVFVSSSALTSLRRLELGSPDWRSLASLAPLRLARATVSSWGVFDDGELEGLQRVPSFAAARALGLASTEFINPIVIREIIRCLRQQHEAVRGFEAVQLSSRYGVMEGAAAWLLQAARATDTVLPAVRRWGVELGEVSFSLQQEPSTGRFSGLRIDLSLPETFKGERESTGPYRVTLGEDVEVIASNFARRLTTAAGVLVQLAPAALREVVVSLTPGTQLRASERDTLRAAARRSGQLESFVIEGEAFTP